MRVPTLSRDDFVGDCGSSVIRFDRLRVRFRSTAGAFTVLGADVAFEIDDRIVWL